MRTKPISVTSISCHGECEERIAKEEDLDGKTSGMNSAKRNVFQGREAAIIFQLQCSKEFPWKLSCLWMALSCCLDLRLDVVLLRMRKIEQQFYSLVGKQVVEE